MKKIMLIAVLWNIATFVQAQKWETSFDESKAKSAQEGKNIFLYFIHLKSISIEINFVNTAPFFPFYQ
jgi:hypothetical protein